MRTFFKETLDKSADETQSERLRFATRSLGRQAAVLRRTQARTVCAFHLPSSISHIQSSAFRLPPSAFRLPPFAFRLLRFFAAILTASKSPSPNHGHKA
jgi:hypothetical protein